VQQLVQDKSASAYNSVNQVLGAKLPASNSLQNVAQEALVSLSGSGYGVIGTIWSLDSVSNMDLGIATATWNTDCADAIPYKYTGSESPKQRIFMDILRDAMGDGAEADGCESVLKYCQWDSLAGVRARQICPETCGCDDPGAGIALGGLNNGCSPSCTRTKAFKKAQSTRQCEDLGNTSQYWAKWNSALGNLSLSYPKSWRPMYTHIRREVGKDHCAIVGNSDIPAWRHICEKSDYYFLKPLVHACPISCGCNVTLHPHCPVSCRLSGNR